MRPDPSPALVSNVSGGYPDATCSTLSVMASGLNAPCGGAPAVGSVEGLGGVLGLALPGTAVALGGEALSVGA